VNKNECGTARGAELAYLYRERNRHETSITKKSVFTDSRRRELILQKDDWSSTGRVEDGAHADRGGKLMTGRIWKGKKLKSTIGGERKKKEGRERIVLGGKRGGTGREGEGYSERGGSS